MQYCECGFTDESIRAEAVPTRLSAAVGAITEALRDDAVSRRPGDGRWSALEYAAHVRDVLITIRDRTVVGLVQDDPTFAPMYRDQRVDLGLYAGDDAASVATELASVASLFTRTFRQIEPLDLERPVRYGFPEPIHTTIGWMAKQAVHEAEHHLADIEENRRLLGA